MDRSCPVRQAIGFPVKCSSVESYYEEMRSFAVFAVVSLVLMASGTQSLPRSAAEIATDIYRTCLASEHGLKCAKAKALAWMANVAEQDEIPITESLTIVRTGTEEPEQPADTEQQRSAGGVRLLNSIDSFLSTHALKMTPPAVLQSEEARAYIPDTLLQGGLADNLIVPLTEGNVAEGLFSSTTLCCHLIPYPYLFFLS